MTESTGGPSAPDWVVFRPDGEPRWGSEVRRRRLFEVLAQRTKARSVRYWTLLERRGNAIPLRWLRRARGARRPLLAASEQPPLRARDLVATWTRPYAVAIYDEPIAQATALGLPLLPERREELQTRLDLSVALFERLIVPTESFARLAGLPPEKVIAAGNGTDTRRIAPGPWPEQLTVGMASGAASGRGIEALLDAVAVLRATHPGVRLRLWLVATGEASVAYLSELRDRVAGWPWVEIDSVAHRDLGAALSGATVLCIPHPANAYMDVALPVKLLDSLAAGRPVVVTPRTETAAIVERHGAGIVTKGDTPDHLAAAIDQVLADGALARRLGDFARRAAVRHYDWDVVGGRLADTLMAHAADRPA